MRLSSQLQLRILETKNRVIGDRRPYSSEETTGRSRSEGGPWNPAGRPRNLNPDRCFLPVVPGETRPVSLPWRCHSPTLPNPLLQDRRGLLSPFPWHLNSTRSDPMNSLRQPSVSGLWGRRLGYPPLRAPRRPGPYPSLQEHVSEMGHPLLQRQEDLG